MPIEYFFTSPEIEEWCSDSQLREKYGIASAESGWYPLDNDDVALVITRYGKNKVYIWIGIDPRDEMEKLLDLPTCRRSGI